MRSSYHAVSIRHRKRCCRAVEALDGQRFLSDDAPSLPLAACSNPNGCVCRYKHHSDRRDEPRRDTDVGLPDRYFHGLNRRQRAHGRRASDAA